jgi:hypothetical protein
LEDSIPEDPKYVEHYPKIREVDAENVNELESKDDH